MKRILAFSSTDRLGGLVVTAEREKRTERETQTKKRKKRDSTGDKDIDERNWKALNLTSCPPGRFWVQ